MVPFGGLELMTVLTNMSLFSIASFSWQTFWIADKNFNAPIWGVSPSSFFSTSVFALGLLEHYKEAYNVVNERSCRHSTTRRDSLHKKQEMGLIWFELDWYAPQGVLVLGVYGFQVDPFQIAYVRPFNARKH